MYDSCKSKDPSVEIVQDHNDDYTESWGTDLELSPTISSTAAYLTGLQISLIQAKTSGASKLERRYA